MKPSQRTDKIKIMKQNKTSVNKKAYVRPTALDNKLNPKPDTNS